MNLSGILITTTAADVAAVADALRALPQVEVARVEPERGLIVVVQEAADVGAEVEGFTRIRALPGVRAADLVYHYFGGDDGEPAVPAAA